MTASCFLSNFAGRGGLVVLFSGAAWGALRVAVAVVFLGAAVFFALPDLVPRAAAVFFFADDFALVLAVFFFAAVFFVPLRDVLVFLLEGFRAGLMGAGR